eukprot:4006893-Pyramimonas_sp.AAC.1
MYDALIIGARSVQFPMRLHWVLLDSYSQPRVIRAFGCWSKSTRALQGTCGMYSCYYSDVYIDI